MRERERKGHVALMRLFFPYIFPVCTVHFTIHLNMENRLVTVQRRLFAATRKCTFSLIFQGKLQRNSMTPQTYMVFCTIPKSNKKKQFSFFLSTFKKKQSKTSTVATCSQLLMICKRNFKTKKEFVRIKIIIR